MRFLVVFAYLSTLAYARYRFRFHTCIKEDQAILEKENVNSPRQFLFIDDGQSPKWRENDLEGKGILMSFGNRLKNLTNGYETGAEQALRVLEFNNTEHFLVINFWMRSYYFMKNGDKYQLSYTGTTIKPDLNHFIRVYFICAPANSQSALIVFGDQSKPRVLKSKKSKREAALIDENSGKKLKKCQKIRTKRAAAVNNSTEWTQTLKDTRRLKQRSEIYSWARLSFIHLGFGMVVIVNAIVFLFFFKYFKKFNSTVKNGDQKQESDETDEKTEKTEKQAK
ncbi:Protein EMP46 [Caenorhabditis elegans]|uniref:Protein EMP46 n=1 Tax=Caenorhabditis elegans TaxID=6239 RepID=Q9N2V5_CAEEL|nr:Protein EMP46 [Caenorhabditis elegans]CCD73550.1 Protein EMP46 [Caenorhabditis elegans]|eukprot:NP_490791.3 Uncharacterized protein CELE_Y95B8A.4 [Caenorhabditis elegans]